jgi:hypothetical protein
MSEDLDPAIQTIITKYTDVFELQVLACCIQLPKFYYANKEHIGTFDSAYAECNEFTAEVDNEIYSAVAKYYDALSAGENSADVAPCPWGWVDSILKGKIAQNKLNADMLANGHIRFKAALNQNANDFNKTVSKGMSFWLTQKRIRRGVNPILQDFSKGVDDVKSIIDKVESSVIGMSERSTTGLMAGIMDDDDMAGDLIPFPLPSLNNAMEGGATKGESILVVAPQNAGKTVFATFCTRFWAEMQYKVLFVSTEEPVTRITPRVVASGLEMEYKRMARGLRERNFEDQEWGDISNYLGSIEDNVRFKYYKHEAKGIAGLLPNIIDMEIESGFTPDIVVLDWLGGGLGEKDRNDNNTMTQFYKESANRLKTVMDDYNVMLMCMAQGGIMKCKDQKLIDASMIDNCTGLGERFVFGLGISCLQENTVDKSIKQGTWKKAQYMNPFKVRYSVGGAIPIIRKFECQRFIDALSQPADDGAPAQDNPVRRHT